MKSSKPGYYLIFDGENGCGKSTAVKRLKESKKYADLLVFTHEPGSTECGKVIRELIFKSKNGEKISNIANLSLFCADRAINMENVVIPAIKDGKIVISDRSYVSTYVFQGIERADKEIKDAFWGIHKQIFKEYAPNLFVWFSATPQTCINRCTARNASKDPFENVPFSEVERRYDDFFKFTHYMTSHEIIDAEQSEEIVYAEVEKIVDRFVVKIKGEPG
jgi:dTMP kinase